MLLCAQFSPENVPLNSLSSKRLASISPADLQLLCDGFDILDLQCSIKVLPKNDRVNLNMIVRVQKIFGMENYNVHGHLTKATTFENSKVGSRIKNFDILKLDFNFFLFFRISNF